MKILICVIALNIASVLLSLSLPPDIPLWTWNNSLVPNRKGVLQGYILSPCLFNLYAEYIMRNAGLEEAQAGIRLPGEILITSDMQMTPTLWQKVKMN